MARKRVGNKRVRIIAAAAKLFGDKGYHDTTTAEIAESAGRTTPTARGSSCRSSDRARR
jgi:AcrR family transcriptional regulator